MRKELIEHAICELTTTLSSHLRDEGITLVIAANDNIPPAHLHVMLEAFQDMPLSSNKSLTEFQIILSVLGKNWQNDALIESIYQCLQSHQLTVPETTVLLSSLHVETVVRMRTKKHHRRAIMRYILEEETIL